EGIRFPSSSWHPPASRRASPLRRGLLLESNRRSPVRAPRKGALGPFHRVSSFASRAASIPPLEADLRISRRFTREGESPYAGIPFEKRASEIRNPDGSTVFRLENVEVPAHWSQVATDILAQKYFRKAGVPKLDPSGETVSGGERDSRQVFHRLAGCWADWGKRYGYFSIETDAQAFHDEMCHMLAGQIAAPHPPPQVT